MNISIKQIAAIAAFGAFICAPGTTFSQTETIEPDTLLGYELEKLIVTASRYKEAPFTVGRNVTVISSEEIENSFHFSVGDILAEQQSVHIIGNGQTPGSLTQGFLRGSNSNHYVVMLNGIRISDPSTVNNAVNLAELSLLGVKRIEIVRGSHSTLYGSSAIGGVINIITRKKGRSGFNMNASTRNGLFNTDTYSTANNLMANYTSPQGWYANFGIYQQYTNGFDATTDTVTNSAIFNSQDSDGFQKLDILGRVGYKTSTMDVYLSYRNEDQTAELDQGAFNDDDNAKVNFNRGLLGYGGSYGVNESIEFEFKGAYSNLTRNFINDSSRVNEQGDFDGTFVETNAEGALWKNGLTATLKRSFIQSIIGIESSVQTMTLRNYVYSRSQFGVFKSETDLDSLDLKETIYSGFLQIDLNGGLLARELEEFSLVLGGRLLNHNQFGTHYTYAFTPKVQISNSTLLYGSLSTGYNVPSLYQLYSPERGAAGQFTLGNPNLEPEQSISYELGWKQRIGNHINFKAAFFNTRVKNIISYVYLWAGSTAIADLTFEDYLGDTYINLSNQDIKGFELALNIRPLQNVSLGGNLALTESTLNFSPDDINTAYVGGNHVQVFNNGQFVASEKELERLTRRPQASAFIWLSYRPIQPVKLQISSRFIGSRDDIFYSANLGPFGALDRSQIDGYNLTDISGQYQINPQFSIGAKIENLFNTDYVELNGYATQGRGIFLRIQYEFGSF